MTTGDRIPLASPGVSLEIGFMPVCGGQGYSPNILLYRQLDSAVQGLLGIDVDDLGVSTFARQVDVNFDLHPHGQCDRSRDQCPVKVDDDCLTCTSQMLSNALSLDHER